jgi:hypothetical protein
MNTASKQRLRWYQYSLRSLFVVMVLVAIGGKWFAVKRQQVERQRAAVNAIDQIGGYIGYDYQFDASRRPIRNAVPPGPVWVRDLLGDDFFAQAEYLVLYDCRTVTDAELARLVDLPQLRVLHLNRTQFTGAGLEHLRELTQLKELSFHGVKVTDAELEHLKCLTQLEELSLDDTKVTDIGLEHLQSLTCLKSLNLGNAKVTDVGVKRLQQALPVCRITRHTSEALP